MSEPSHSPLEKLASETGMGFENLLAGRRRTCDGLIRYRADLKGLVPEQGVAVVLMGSWGRAEVTSKSDNDFVILDDTNPVWNLASFKKQVEEILKVPPSADGPFAQPVRCEPFVEQIGLQEDSNHHLTRRMLLLLESVPVLGDELYHSLRGDLLHRYLDQSIKNSRPPRFLLNDIVRYWRTICVDFAGKERKDDVKWGIRNAKLRTSRKLLFAAGLLPALRCYELEKDGMFKFLSHQFSLPPTDRIADAFIRYEMFDEGARTLSAYDEFLGLLGDEDFRSKLSDTQREDSDFPEFAKAQSVGREIQGGLLALLFESTGELPKIVRDYAIF